MKNNPRIILVLILFVLFSFFSVHAAAENINLTDEEKIG
ncbi:hypothetical protein JOC47_002314 [Halanaerobacter jeridensis]|uniref:Uncharacterized protein n=1 Tax=Halanaerobacter jeridensis TaxID=706427 RepID=A0A938XTW2_9FIRM|nr:hypothetical protein [Halanaerobacter jeridensis]